MTKRSALHNFTDDQLVSELLSRHSDPKVGIPTSMSLVGIAQYAVIPAGKDAIYRLILDKDAEAHLQSVL